LLLFPLLYQKVVVVVVVVAMVVVVTVIVQIVEERLSLVDTLPKNLAQDVVDQLLTVMVTLSTFHLELLSLVK
jgi:hypothetical protein